MEQLVNQQFQLELSPELAEGTYSNLAIIAHSLSEFVIDFARIMPNTFKAKVKSRIILTPENAKRFMLALQDNIAKHEQKHGKINLNDPSMPVFDGIDDDE